MFLLLLALVIGSFCAPNGGECEICEMVVGYVEGFLENNKTQYEIETELEKICKILPGEWSTACAGLVDEYLPMIIQYIENDFPANVICKDIGMCTSEVKTPESDDEYCQICVWIVTFAESWLKDNKTEEEIQAELEKMCSYFGSYADECKQLVDQYLDPIIQYIEQEMPAKQICQLVGLCNSTQHVKPMPAKTDMCSICQWLVNLAENYLENNKTEEEIMTELNHLCSFMGSYSSECKSLVDTYLPMIISYIEQELPPKTICTMIGMCTSKFEKHLRMLKRKSEALDKCDLCKWAATLAEKYLENNKTEEEIMKELNALCGYFPTQYQSECKVMVDEYLPTLIDYLEQEAPPAVICQTIGLCTSGMKRMWARHHGHKFAHRKH